MNKITEDLQNEVQWELENNILPFWMNRMIDNEYGGFHGQITGNGQRVVHAPKGAILNARILWTFSAAYRDRKSTRLNSSHDRQSRMPSSA